MTKRGRAGKELTETGAVDIGHFAEVEKDLTMSAGSLIEHEFLQYHACTWNETKCFAPSDTAAQVEDSYLSNLSHCVIHAHGNSSLGE
jgi:hypothetical protein